MSCSYGTLLPLVRSGEAAGHCCPFLLDLPLSWVSNTCPVPAQEHHQLQD